MVARKEHRFPAGDNAADYDPFWAWVGSEFTGPTSMDKETMYAEWVIKGKPGPRKSPDPVKSAQWLTAFCCKWPAADGPDTEARDHILRLIDAFVPLNEQATKGEIDPGFWGRFAARCQKALKDVRAQAQAVVDGIEADSRFQAEPALVQVNAPLALIQVEMKAQHALAKQVLEWLAQH